MAWDPKVYLKFAKERTRPAQDLLERISLRNPKRVADLGCGPGNSTALLRARWPEAEIEGIDTSSDMLRDARASGVEAKFIQADIATWTPAHSYELIYSNAALQWLGDHENLFSRLWSFLAPGGVLAFQVPRNFDETCQVIVREVAADARWAGQLKDAKNWWNGLAPEAYYDLLCVRAESIDIWETRYFHILEGENAVYNWMSGTSLRPFVEALDAAAKIKFQDQCRARLAEAYHPYTDGNVMLPFLRLFLVAQKAYA